MSTSTIDIILISPKGFFCQILMLTGRIASSRFLVVLKATGTSALRVVEILIALQATGDRNVKSHCWRNFGSSESYSQQECYLPLLIRFWQLRKATLPTPTVDGRHMVFQVFGSSDSYRSISC